MILSILPPLPSRPKTSWPSRCCWKKTFWRTTEPMTKPPMTHFADLAFCHNNLSILNNYNLRSSIRIHSSLLLSCGHHHHGLAQVLLKVFLFLRQLYLLFFLFYNLFLLWDRHHPATALYYYTTFFFELFLDFNIPFKFFFGLEFLLLFLLSLGVFYLLDGLRVNFQVFRAFFLEVGNRFFNILFNF